MATCVSCGIIKDKGLIGGLCRKCYNKLYYRRYRQENRQHYDNYHKRYYQENKDRWANIYRK